MTEGISPRRLQTCKRIIEALGQSSGLLTLAAKRAGVSYSLVKQYARDFPSVREAVQDAKESMLDFTEGKLFSKIQNGDTVAILFYLKTQGKARGYIERYEHTGEGGGPVQVSAEVILKKLTALAEVK